MLVHLAALVLAGGGPEIQGPKWDGETFRRYADASAQVAFEVPMSEFLLESEHFDSSLPLEKAKHMFTLWGPRGVEVTVDVWLDPERRDAAIFLDKVLPFLRHEGASLASVMIARPRVLGLLIAQPHTGQSFARRTALFCVGGRVFRVTCHDADDARERKVFERILDSFEPTTEVAQ